MDFEDALQRTQRLEKVGPLRLRYETSLLIAEPPRVRADVRRLLLQAGGAGLMLLAVAQLAAAQSGTVGTAPLIVAILGVGLFAAAPRVFPTPSRRRFILNFGTESVRIDDVGDRPRTRVLRFDDVSALEVVNDGGGFALELIAKKAPLRERLVSAVGPDDVDDLRTLWRILSDAFGIKRGGVDL